MKHVDHKNHHINGGCSELFYSVSTLPKSSRCQHNLLLQASKNRNYSWAITGTGTDTKLIRYYPQAFNVNPFIASGGRLRF